MNLANSDMSGGSVAGGGLFNASTGFGVANSLLALNAVGAHAPTVRAPATASGQRCIAASEARSTSLSLSDERDVSVRRNGRLLLGESERAGPCRRWRFSSPLCASLFGVIGRRESRSECMRVELGLPGFG